MTPPRDPRIFPAPGDVVRAKDGRVRLVEYAVGGQVQFLEGGESRVEFRRSWRSWCCKNQAEVVEVGK